MIAPFVLLLCAGTLQPVFEKLPNGLRVCVVEDHALPLVSVQVWYRVGSSFDPPDKPGLTHLARMLLSQRLAGADGEPAGGGETFRDACRFSTLILSHTGAAAASAAATGRELDRALELEALRMSEFAPSREEIREALARAADRPAQASASPRTGADWPVDAQAMRSILAAAFEDHPYEHPPSFVTQSLAEIDPALLREHIERWFAPTNATLFIIGDVNSAAAIELARARFAGVAWRDTPRRADFDSPPQQRIELPARPAGAQARRVTLAWVTPPFGSYENAVIDVLMQRLCNACDGPLFKVLSQEGFAPPEWRHQAWRQDGLLVLTAMVAGPTEAAPVSDSSASVPTRFRRVVDAIDRLLTSAAAAPPTAVELNRARALAARDVLERRDGPCRRALVYAMHEIVGGDILLADYELPRAEHVAAGDLMRGAQLLLEARRVVLVDDPPADSQRGGTSQRSAPLRGAAGLLDHAFSGETVSWPAELRTWLERQATTRELGQGLRLTLLPTPTAALVRVEVGIAGCDPAGSVAQRRRDALHPFVGAPQQLDYSTYQGFAVTTDGCGIAVRGPLDRLDSIVEWSVRAVRSDAAAAGSAIELRVCGDAEFDQIARTAREAWGMDNP